MEADSTGSIALLVTYASIALGFSFLCSIAEAVLLTVSPSYIESLKETRAGQARLLEELKNNIDRPLAAILSLNTVAHTVGAVGVGAQAAAIWGDSGVGIASGVMTFLILVASEIIPKTIGAVYWRALAGPTAQFVRVLIALLLPLVWLSELITRVIAGSENRHVVTREEVAAMAGLSNESGEMKTVESRMVKNLLALEKLTVEDIMTPRTVLIAFPRELTVGELMEKRPDLPVSRLPIYDESIDRVTGFVLKSDVLLAQARNEPDAQLMTLRRDLRAVPSTASLSKLFETLLGEREHIALVIDEYGGTDGLVTMEDVLETVLGMEIVDEADVIDDMQRLARQQWEQRAKALGLEVVEENAPRQDSSSDSGDGS